MPVMVPDKNAVVIYVDTEKCARRSAETDDGSSVFCCSVHFAQKGSIAEHIEGLRHRHRVNIAWLYEQANMDQSFCVKVCTDDMLAAELFTILNMIYKRNVFIRSDPFFRSEKLPATDLVVFSTNPDVSFILDATFGEAKVLTPRQVRSHRPFTKCMASFKQALKDGELRLLHSSTPVKYCEGIRQVEKMNRSLLSASLCFREAPSELRIDISAKSDEPVPMQYVQTRPIFAPAAEGIVAFVEGLQED